jgi:TolB protein
MKFIYFLLTVGLLLSPKNNTGIFEKSNDVGNCKIPGSAVFDSKSRIYTLTGAGMNIWANSDEFHFVWKKVTGDFTMQARIAFEGKGVVLHRKMGIMIRETLNGDSPYADAVVHGDGLTSLQYRLTKGDVTKEIKTEIKGADHIVLIRSGNKIFIRTGIGDYPVTNTAETEITLPETCYVGLFICSHDEKVVEKGYFYDLKFKKK